MSTTTGQKRTYREALEDAEAFKALFPASCYERWTFAGSLRRKRETVGDVEHVVQPKFTEEGDGLFGGTVRVNLLMRRVDELAEQGLVSRHLYGTNPATGAPLWRWGEKYRGVDFRGFNHEIFCADADNWGAVLLIRTGPAEYSQRVVTALKDGGMYRQVDGYLVHVASGGRVPVRDEATYLNYAGLPFVVPEKRT